MFPEGMDMSALLAQAQEMQNQLTQAQEELANATFTGTAGGGLVEAVITGTSELVGLTIKPEAVDVDDLESLSDLIIAAVRDAATKASAQAHSVLPNLDELGF